MDKQKNNSKKRQSTNGEVAPSKSDFNSEYKKSQSSYHGKRKRKVSHATVLLFESNEDVSDTQQYKKKRNSMQQARKNTVNSKHALHKKSNEDPMKLNNEDSMESNLYPDEDSNHAKQLKKFHMESNGEHSDGENSNESEGDVSSQEMLNIRESSADIEVKNHSTYNSLPSFMKSFSSFFDEDDDGLQQKVVRNYEEESSIDDTDKNSQFVDSYSGLIEEIRSFSDITKKRQVILVNSSSPVQLLGHLKIVLIAGKASVCGYNLKRNQPVTVFSHEKTGLLLLETSSRAKDFSSSNLIMTLHGVMTIPGDINVKQFMRKNLKKSAAVVMVEELRLPPAMMFLKLYLPQATSFRTVKNIESVYATSKSNETHHIKITKEYEFVFNSTVKHLLKANKEYASGYKNAIESGTDWSDLEMDSAEENEIFRSGHRILVTGPKKSGKSSLLRYLINRFLNMYEEVFYLDTDPGQTEFTPPGVVSLSRVTEPVFGPPYTHQRNPLKMVFIGTITPETSPKMCTESVKYLLKYFNKNHPKSILLVNTMGWYEGIGDMIIEVIKDYVQATVEINLHPYSQPPTVDLDDEEGFLKMKVVFSFDTLKLKKKYYSPADLREFALIAHLGISLGHHCKATYINESRPYCIRWDDIAVYNFNKKLPYSEYYDSLIGSIVALCEVREPYLLKSTNPDYPNTVEDDHVNECLGFGLITCGDEKQRLFFLVTPLKLDVLRRVNVIMTGNILLPHSLVLKQPLWNVELPYTDSASEGGTPGRRFIQRRA